MNNRIIKSAGAGQLVDALTAARLLVASWGEGYRPVIEVAHEALLTSWPRLTDWIRNAREDLRLLRLLKRDAAEWERNRRAEDYRWSYRRQRQAKQMLKRLQPDLSDVERLFLVTKQDCLVDELNDPTTPLQQRVAIGDRLAEINDPRPGVGRLPDDLPDLLWVQIPGTAAVRASDLFPNFTGLRLGNGAKRDPEAGSDENWPANAAPLEIPDFELAAYPLTVTQFKPFVDQGGYRQDRYWSEAGRTWRNRENRQVPGWWNDPAWTLANRPVVGVSWYEVEAYCNWLNEQLQLLPVTIRLPTEAEWEWAARGPEGRCYPWGDKWEAWHCNGSQSGIGRTSAVGSFPGGASDWWQVIWPDGEVVHDLAGNVWEWTASEYSEDYSKADQSVLNLNPGGPCCVVRGGSWNGAPGRLRGAARSGRAPRAGYDGRGCRLARTLTL